MKNGALVLFVSFCMLEAMTPSGVTIPGFIDDEVLHDALDAQVADCVADLIQCLVDEDVFAYGTNEQVFHLFFVRKIDVVSLVSSDIRSAGKQWVTARKKIVEKELLHTFARGGTCNKIALCDHMLGKQCCISRDARPLVQQVCFFYSAEFPKILGSCGVESLQRLMREDPQVRASIKCSTLSFGASLLDAIVKKKGDSDSDGAWRLIQTLGELECKPAQYIVARYKDTKSQYDDSSFLSAVSHELCALQFVQPLMVAVPERTSSSADFDLSIASNLASFMSEHDSMHTSLSSMCNTQEPLSPDDSTQVTQSSSVDSSLSPSNRSEGVCAHLCGCW